jgi:uncharacterized protein (DUF58 family)
VSAAATSLLQLRKRQRQEPPPLLLNLQELERFENLLVFAKAIVEGYFAGKHKSPYRGSAAEFADYKEYTPGDEIARLDWRVYGRTRRLYLRQFEEETDMTVYLMLDTSGSMRYAGDKRQSKFFLAAKIAAALAYLMMSQNDKAALALFAQKVTSYLAPGGTRRHLHRMVTELERVRPALSTGIAGAVQECTALFKKRGRIVILSDFLDDTGALFDALSQFVHRKFEILLLQIVDPDELNLPAFNAAKFVDLETAEMVQVDPEEIRASYQAHMQRLIDDLAREADLRQIQHKLVDTRRPYLDAIEAYLGFRGRNERNR